jgi:crossover junction endodeoxyribonuclease RusA
MSVAHTGDARNMTAVTLPMPPSTNSLFYNKAGKGRKKTERYRAWRNEAGWELVRQRPPRTSGPVFVEIRLPDLPGRAVDADNAAKAIFDLLVSHCVIDGDDKRILRGFIVQWERGRDQVYIEIWGISAGDCRTVTWI